MISAANTGMPNRQCGTRVPGGTYLEVAESPYGDPPWKFYLCPAIELPLREIGINSARGVFVREYMHANHVFDWVGEDNYPNLLDVIKEGEFMGWSRRFELQNPAEYALINRKSRLFLIHRRAINRKHAQYVQHIIGEEAKAFQCAAKRLHLLSDCTQFSCLGLGFHDVKEGINWKEHLKQSKAGTRVQFERELECGISYKCYGRPVEFQKQSGLYLPGAITRLPVGRIVVVEDTQDGSHEKALKKVKQHARNIDVDLVPE